MDYELITVAAAAITGFVLARRLGRRRTARNGIEAIAPPAVSPAEMSVDCRMVTLAEMEDMNQTARQRRQGCLASRW
ncbi:hypothetical protein C4J81_06815 [Deltaproteobacteria bacterium Smac51]|nr:hypothetical protein C4J81_06815 [Deltaproteobacteria bacterium Smac51]